MRKTHRLLQVVMVAVIIQVEVEKPSQGVNSVRSKVSAVSQARMPGGRKRPPSLHCGRTFRQS
jgi:hypothetical protein